MIKRIVLLLFLLMQSTIFCMNTTTHQFSKEQIDDLVLNFSHYGYVVNQKPSLLKSKLVMVPLAIAGTCIGTYCAFRYFTNFATQHDGEQVCTEIKTKFAAAQTEITQSLSDQKARSKEVGLAINNIEKECDFTDLNCSNNPAFKKILSSCKDNSRISNQIVAAAASLHEQSLPIGPLMQETTQNKLEAQSVAQRASAALDQSTRNESQLESMLEHIEKLNQMTVPPISRIPIRHSTSQ